MSDTVAVPARKASAPDVADVSQALAEAFFDDPTFIWCYPDQARRRQLLPDFFRIVVETYLPHDEVYATEDFRAGAVGVPFGAEVDEEQLGEALGELSEEDASRLLELAELTGAVHPTEPHGYLFFLGTRPSWQSRGIGSGLLEQVLEPWDRAGLPAYLEATSEANKRLYLRHGFRVSGEIQLPDGPTLWPMWREPS